MKRVYYTFLSYALYVLFTLQKVYAQGPGPDESPPQTNQQGKGPGDLMEKFKAAEEYSSESVMSVFLEWFYRIVMGSVTALAILSIIISGFQLMLSQGDSEGAGKSKERLMGSILGLVLIILTSVILHTINPDVFKMG